MRYQADEEALVEALGYVGPEEELQDEEDVCGDLWVVSRSREIRRGVLTVRRLVSKVPKPRDRSWSVRYAVEGVVGIVHDKPSR